MKKYLLAVTLIFLAGVIAFPGCTKKKEEQPCNGKGTLNIENKSDSAISVFIVQSRSTYTIGKDYTLPFILTGDQPYNLKISGKQFEIEDTAFMILNCDNKLYVITQP